MADKRKIIKRAGGKTVKQPAGRAGAGIWKVWLSILAIVTVTYIVFSPALQNDFVNWDDQEYVTENPMVVNTTIPLREIFSKPVSGNYHPLTMLTLAMNYHSGKLNASGYHAVNLIMHLLNTLLTFLFIFLLTRRNLLMASVVALFFGIHPMHVESVAWVSERKDVVYVFFFLSGLITYLRFRESKRTAWYITTMLLFIFSCLSKGMAVVFPVILLLLDYYLDDKLNKSAVIQKLPFFFISLFIGIITYHFQQEGLPPDTVIYNPFYRMMFACYGAVMYVAKFFIPANLSVFYPYPSTGHVLSSMLYFPFILLALIALIYFFLRKEKAIVFGLLFYLVTIALVLQFITIGSAIIADRYTYLAYIGLLFAAAHIINKAWKDKGTMLASLKYPIAVVVIIAAIAFSFQTSARTHVWKNGETLWTDAVNNFPGYYNSYSNRGEYYQSISEDDKAMADFTASLQRNSLYSEAHNNRGLLYYKQGQYKLALTDYDKAVKFNQDARHASSYYMNRALAEMQLKENDKAERDMQQAFILDSLSPQHNTTRLLVNRGYYYDKTGQYEKAIADYTSYLQLKPEDDVLFNARGLCYVKLNKINEAYSDFFKAAELNTAVPNYWLNRSLTENTLGRKKEAKADALKAQELGMNVDTNYLKALEGN